MSLAPHLFRPEAIPTEVLQANAQMLANLPPMPPIETLSVEEMRKRAGAMVFGPRSANARTTTIPGPAGPISFRMFVPREVNGVYLFIHGGGFVYGSNDNADPMLEGIANDCSVAVIATTYRFAPEHPYPAAAEDCEAAALWLAKNAEAEFGSDHLLIGGISAGATLSAMTLLRLRDLHGLTPFSGAVLRCGVYDLNYTPSVRRSENSGLFNYPFIRWHIDKFAPPAKRNDPNVSTLFADLTGLPPAFFLVGTFDPLLDDSVFMHSRWITSGIEAEIEVCPGIGHGGDNADARKREREFIRRVVSGSE